MKMQRSILIDGREFVPGRFTGIGRVLSGLLSALSLSHGEFRLCVALYRDGALPKPVRGLSQIETVCLPSFFILSELRLSLLTRHRRCLFISPYPKLPLFGCACPCIHIVHDVLYMAHGAGKARPRYLLEKWRLKNALRRATLTWFDSNFSLRETSRIAGFTGRNPRVRYPGVEPRFTTAAMPNERDVLSKYHLAPGYILSAGNGLPHKNLGVLLRISHLLERELVFVGDRMSVV